MICSRLPASGPLIMMASSTWHCIKIIAVYHFPILCKMLDMESRPQNTDGRLLTRTPAVSFLYLPNHPVVEQVTIVLHKQPCQRPSFPTCQIQSW